MKLPVVGVMGSGTEDHAALARPLGRLLAESGVHLLTGGGGGAMACVARAFVEVENRAGLVIGVLPGHPAPPGYPNPWVEIAIATHLPGRGGRGVDAVSRNAINVLSSDLVIALPGGAGTASEVELARGYGRRVLLIGWDDAEAIAGDSPGVASVEAAKPLIRDALDGLHRDGLSRAQTSRGCEVENP